MKDRLPALDGLRGFAALAVLLSHIGYNPMTLVSVPLVIAVYKTLQVGPNSVQILFVLSGFLMAFLYPQVKSAKGFIQKRYARIFPIYGTIVMFIWIISFALPTSLWWLQCIILLVLAVLVFAIWKGIKKAPNIGKIVFFSFVGLQLITLALLTLALPHYVHSDTIALPKETKNILILLGNITLTTPFNKDIPRLSLVFWSLAPEIYFYLLYPYIVIPLIRLSRHYGIVVGIIIIVGVTKILFDLDKEFVSVGGLQSINIARSSGFVAGVTIGTIYQTKGKIWQFIEPILKSWIFSIIVLLLFIAIQWGDWAIRDGQSIFFNNAYYLMSSWVISLVILAAIIPRTYVYRIFSNKIIVFLGIISYSLYLIHPQTIQWAAPIRNYLSPLLSSFGLHELAYVIIAVVVSIGIAVILFRVVEFLYFSSKKTVFVTTLAKEGEEVSVNKRIKIFRHPSMKFSFIVLAFFILYVAAFTPSQLITRSTISGWESTKEQTILQKSIRIPFLANHKNLSAISLNIRYAKNASATALNRKHPAMLLFTLFDSSGKQLFTSSRFAYVAEGSPRFGFGFPTIVDSSGKVYTAEIALQNGRADDQIFIDTSSTSFVSIYTVSKKELLHSPWTLIINRIPFALTNQGFLFVLLFLLFVGFLDKRLSAKTKNTTD